MKGLTDAEGSRSSARSGQAATPTRMAQGVLRRMINEVAFVAATDDSRPGC